MKLDLELKYEIGNLVLYCDRYNRKKVSKIGRIKFIEISRNLETQKLYFKYGISNKNYLVKEVDIIGVYKLEIR
jgi:hypothetical protein